MKRVLMFVPKYFEYEYKIKREIECLGYNVTLVYENMDEVNLLYRFVYVYLPAFKKRIVNNYFKSRIKNKKNYYDLIFVIRGASISQKTIEYIKFLNPDARYIMYQWDSVNNNPNALVISAYFDKVSTFDNEDAAKHGWQYRPLFYCEATKSKNNKKYDICYICSLHSQRVRIYNSLLSLAEKYNSFLYMYSKRMHYYKQKYFKKATDFQGLDDSLIQFKSLSLNETNNLYRDSRIIIDYTHPNQNGFTMRTCEAIGHQCKLVTNNKFVKKADFYNENNIYVYDLEDFHIPENFINSPYIELPKDVFERYSLKNWLKEIIDYE